MPRTIVAIDFGQGNTWMMRLEKAPVDIPDARRPCPFNCIPQAMPSWDDPEAVKKHGLKLLKELENHPAVKQAIDQALMVPPGEISPVYFQLTERAAEQLCWETLYSDNTAFLGLDARWPIGRIADSVVDRQLTPQEFSPPLKIAAVLSALNRPAAEQWKSLRDAVDAARADGLEVEVLLLVGEEALLDAIQGEVAGGMEWVHVAAVPDRTQELEGLLGGFEPHILHFFCHGSASHGVPRLEIATILDWMQGNTTGSLKLSVENLQAMPALRKVWLVVLNCCESGRADENSHSMAHMLVSNVVPAAIGTLEPFDASDAHELSLGFFPLLFQNLAEILAACSNGSVVELECATALRGARRGLSEKHKNDPSNNREWAMPVLYTRKESFFLRIEGDAGVPPEQVQIWQQRAEVVAGQLRALPPDTDPVVREAVLGILTDVPVWLKPDLFGEFDQPGQLQEIAVAVGNEQLKPISSPQ